MPPGRTRKQIPLTDAHVQAITGRVKTITGVARELGTSYASVQRELTRRGVRGLKKGRKPGIRDPALKIARNREILKMRGEGKTYLQISAIVGVSVNRVCQIVKRGY